ncbi:methyltransferase domain-containing protein [Aliiglaciecola sp. SL4]|uniref:class I SAM-dependent methyltransferase n=1 Tax=Aliiglaciecola sp. SL4 TaxID=3239806 RepID=UPI00355B206A
MNGFEFELKQGGRATIDFMVNIFHGSATLTKAVRKDADKAAGNIDELPDDLDERNHFMVNSLVDSRPFRIYQLLGEWHSVNHGEAAINAFEEIQPDLQDQLDQLSKGPTKIQIDEDFKAPAYWQGVEFHRTAKAWDGHPYMGFIHGEIIHRRIVGALFIDGITKQRPEVAAMAPKDSYERILEMGCSSGHYTQALALTYPDAEITGIDLSLTMLEHSQRTANLKGWKWHLYQRAAEDTKFESNQFDLVTSFILLHEMPVDAIEKMFTEAFRVLKPGGDLLMSDATRYSDLNKLEQWKADRGAAYGGEPYWRETASIDFAPMLEAAGFINVSSGGMNGAKYPYLIQGTKP